MFNDPLHVLASDPDYASADGWIGRALPRDEDDALLLGAGRYVGDLLPAGCLHAVFVRSAVAHARIALPDVASVRAMPGVRLLLTGHDVLGLGGLAVNSLFDGVRAFATPALALDRVLCVGAPIALVVTETPEQARDAAEAF